MLIFFEKANFFRHANTYQRTMYCTDINFQISTRISLNSNDFFGRQEHSMKTNKLEQIRLNLLRQIVELLKKAY